MGRGKKKEQTRSAIPLSDASGRERRLAESAKAGLEAAADSVASVALGLDPLSQQVYGDLAEIIGTSYGSLSDLVHAIKTEGGDVTTLAAELHEHVERWVTPLAGLPTSLSETLMQESFRRVDWPAIAAQVWADAEQA
jgi:hypothetical protein